MSPKKRKLDHPKTPPHQHQHNPIWRKLQQISSSPFSVEIEWAKFPARFVSPNLAVYDGKGNPVGHLSRYRQSMAIHTSNDALMCRIFPSSLGEPKEIDALLALKIKAEETLKSYSARYWEVYNDIDACDEDIVVKTFRFGLHQDLKLRRSLIKRPPIGMVDLMTRLEEHIRVEDDSKSSARTVEAVTPTDKKAAQPEQGQAKRPRRSTDHPRAGTCMAVHTTFKQPIYRLLPFIKDKPYFEWPTKMPGDPATREGKPYCSYHRECGHLTEQCRAYKYHLEQLVKNGHLKQYIDETKSFHQNTEAPKTTIKDSAPIGIIDESTEQIVFTNQDLEGVQLPHSDALVVTLCIGEFDVKRILIDPGSSVEVMYEPLFKGLGLEKKDLNLVEGPLSSFSGETVVPSGKVTINVKAGTVSSPTEFFVLNAFSPYNAILGRPWLHSIGAVPSTLHQRLRNQEKAPMEVNSNYRARRAVKNAFLKRNVRRSSFRCQLLALLEEYQDVFAWTPYEALGVSSEFVCHELNVSPEYKPVVQRARRTAPQHAEAVREEVERLLKIGAVWEVLYPQWLSNIVVVKKKNGKWRVCVDFTDLNKACPKDPFPLPKIDQLVDSTAGHERMSFLDAFQGYHQIALRKEDQEKTAFITPQGIFCYKVMPFGLKNAGATYQRMVTKMFSKLLGKTVEVYIDDMVVKSVKSTDHVGDLRKCGIEANLDQIAAIQGLQPPRNVKEVQRLTGMAAALNRFISKSAERCRPFFDLIKKGKSFIWNEESDRAFERLKRYLSTPPLLSSPKEGEPFYIYVAASDKAVSAAIIRDDSGEQRPIYYTSKTMSGAESRYLPLEKSALALFITAKKLPHYFQAYTMIVLTFLPLKALFRSSDFSGRISKWGAHLGAYDVRYKPRTSIKGQVLADFITEFAPENSELPTIEEHPKDVERIQEKNGWTLYVDGVANSRGSANQKEAAKIRKKATRYWVSREGKLYKKSYTGPYLLCVHLDLVPNLLYEIHEGVCGGHTGGRSLAHRAIGQGYWWPYMQKDATQYVRRCEKCQLFAPAIHKPASQLNPISSPWQFAHGPFKKYCSEFGIRNLFSSPAYPQGNGQAESSNKTILNGIKKRLEEAKGRWVEELPTILWTFRTTVEELPTGETPFFLTEWTIPSLRRSHMDFGLKKIWSSSSDIHLRNWLSANVNPQEWYGRAASNPSHARCFACKSSSGVAECMQFSKSCLPRLSALPVNFLISGMVERH
uniref:Integrase catalytic domain-containing protein n=1 Tax=Fagus sylvatica TaxID=28930 RepID=A0A2N9EC48_FAGSY